MSIILNRRHLLKGTGALTLLAATQGSTALGQSVRLRGAWWGSTERVERTMQVAQLYENMTGVVFQGEGPGWGDYWPRLATQVAGGNPPDIVQQNHSTIAEYVRNGVLLPLDEYVGNGLDISDFDPVQIEAGTVDGQFYGVSLGYSAFGMIASRPAWEAAGLELPGMDTSWHEFGRMAVQVAQASERQNFFGVQDASGVVGALQSWVRQRGKDLYTIEGRLGYDEEDAAEWFALWAQFREAGACPPAELQALDQLNIETSMLTIGHAATAFGYSNQLVGYQSANQEPLALVPAPMLNDDPSHGVFLQPAQFFSVTRASDVPDEAVAFINFFVRDEGAAKVLGVERGMPASAAVRAFLTPTLDQGSQDMANYLELVGPTGGAMPPAPPAGATELNAILKRTSEEVAFGQRSPQEGAAALIQEADRLLTPA